MNGDFGISEPRTAEHHATESGSAARISSHNLIQFEVVGAKWRL